MSDSEDFEEQLRLEVEDRARRSAAADQANAGRTKVDPDGTVYEWDLEKHAWFPKIDQDFIAQYLMNYGTYSSSSSADSKATSAEVAPPDPSDPSYAAWYYRSYYGVDPDVTDPAYKQWCNSYYGSSETDPSQSDDRVDGMQTGDKTDNCTDTKAGEKKELDDKAKEKDGKLLKRKELSWFELEEEHNSNVYVNGLPKDITQAEFEELMTKCGLIAYDYDKKKPKLKLYKDADGTPKGDGLCSYIKKESLALALQIVDGYELRGCTVHVEPAQFQLKGAFDPTLRKKPKSNKLKRKLKEKQEKLLDWHPDALPGVRKKSDKVVILKNMFAPQEFDKDPIAIQDIREDIRAECSKYGQVKKVTVFDRNTDGVILVVYKEPEEADACIAALSGRWFAGRKAEAETWDGKSKYEVEETEQEREERIRKWESYLEKGAEAGGGVRAPAALVTLPAAAHSVVSDSVSPLSDPTSTENADKSDSAATVACGSVADATEDVSTEDAPVASEDVAMNDAADVPNDVATDNGARAV